MEVHGTAGDTECAHGGSEQKEKSALALSTDELEEFTLSCIVCRNDIPLGRAKRRKQTCSVQCFDKMKAWYKYQALKRKCPACHAPYSEKQRADFRQWRMETGQLRAKAGRPPKTVDTKAPGQDSISKSDLTSEEINHAHDQGVRTIDCNTLTGDADVNQCTGWQGNSATSGELDNRDEHGRGDDSESVHADPAFIGTGAIGQRA